ncbi:MAG: AAA family ATPase [Proteobacteria bacterium]|nr:AAA family ATPase [Pseudomonadota bacterium]
MHSPLLLTALSWVDLAIFCEVQRVRARGRALGKDAPWGAYIGEGEVDEILGDLLEIGPFRVEAETSDRLRGLLEEREDALDLARAEAGGDDPLTKLERAFGLNRHDVQLLLLALAPEVNARYLRLFAYLQDDLGAQHLTPALALRLLTDERAERLDLSARLAPDAPLLAGGLLALAPTDRPTPLPARPVTVAPRIARWLLQGEAWDPDLEPWATLTDPADAHPARAAVAHAVDGLLKAIPSAAGSPVIRLTARSRRDVLEAARHLALNIGAPLLTADLGAAARLGIPAEPLARPIAREARLQGAVCLVVGAPEADPLGDPLAPLLVATEGSGQPLVVHGENGVDTRPLSQGRRHLKLDLPGMALSERSSAWTEAIASLRRRAGRSKKVKEALAALDADVLARRFRYSPGQIAQVIDAATDRAAVAGRPWPSADDVFAACAETFLPDPGPLAERAEVRRGWADLILPVDTRAMLIEMVSQVERREEVLEALGASRVRHGERGTKALFSGPPGTGKTLAAEVLAHALGYPLFRVDLSSIVSKYVGETEKHLSRLFVATEESPCVLLFDEADALFGKRAEVKGAQDRFANLEVSYLLQRLESFDGVAILTTNLKRNVDEAFLRRFTFVVDFPFPERAQREEIWRRVLPEAYPLEKGLSIEDLAAEFKLAGANIWNVAVAASVAAAGSSGKAITRDLLRHAVRREYEKLGREVQALRPAMLAGGSSEALEDPSKQQRGRAGRTKRQAISAAEARRRRQGSASEESAGG